MALEVIALVGLQGSGKTEVAKALAKFDVVSIRMGDIVWDEIKCRGQEIKESTVAAVANEFRKREGLGAIAKRCIPLIESRGKGKQAVVVDGIRGIAEVDELRHLFGDSFHLLAVWASEKTRYSRIASRGRVDDVIKLKSFREKDRRELSWGLGEAFALADFIIVNEGTLDDLYNRAVKLFENLVGGKA